MNIQAISHSQMPSVTSLVSAEQSRLYTAIKSAITTAWEWLCALFRRLFCIKKPASPPLPRLDTFATVPRTDPTLFQAVKGAILQASFSTALSLFLRDPVPVKNALLLSSVEITTIALVNIGKVIFPLSSDPVQKTAALILAAPAIGACAFTSNYFPFRVQLANRLINISNSAINVFASVLSSRMANSLKQAVIASTAKPNFKLKSLFVAQIGSNFLSHSINLYGQYVLRRQREAERKHPDASLGKSAAHQLARIQRICAPIQFIINLLPVAMTFYYRSHTSKS